MNYIKYGVAALLLIALFDLPYDYYEILRIVVFVFSLVQTYRFFNQREAKWTIIFGVITLVFNPIVPTYLSKEIWIFLDVLSAIFISFSPNIENS